MTGEKAVLLIAALAGALFGTGSVAHASGTNATAPTISTAQPSDINARVQVAESNDSGSGDSDSDEESDSDSSD